MLDAIIRVLQSAVASNQTDKYGFPIGKRQYPYNMSFLMNFYQFGTLRQVWKRDELFELTAVRKRGDFHTPTDYKIAQTVRTGYSITPYMAKTLSNPVYRQFAVGGHEPRHGSHETFNFLPHLEAKAAALINAKILDEANQWSAMVDTAELGQTVGLLKSLSTRFLGFTYGVLERNPKLILESLGVKPTRVRVSNVKHKLYAHKARGGTVADASADIWLEYRYGIRPLVYSLQNYRDALIEGYDPEFTAQVTVLEKLEFSALNNLAKWQGFQWRNREDGRVMKSVRLKATVSFRDSLKARIRGNPVAESLGTAWELIPWSFVFDWVAKVGDYINQLNLETLLSSFKCVRTVKSLVTYEAYVSDFTAVDPGCAFKPIPANVAESRTRFFSRTNVGLLLGDLLWGTGLSPTLRQLDAAALTFSNVRRLQSSTLR